MCVMEILPSHKERVEFTRGVGRHMVFSSKHFPARENSSWNRRTWKIIIEDVEPRAGVGVDALPTEEVFPAEF